MTAAPMSAPELVAAAEKLVPLLRATAREAERARRPLDEVIDAVRESGLFSLMVPRAHGGHEADLDTFFEVSLTLSRADASMGWLIGFYIEHAWWLSGFPRPFQDELYADGCYVLAPGALNVTGGSATKVDGAYRVRDVRHRLPGLRNRRLLRPPGARGLHGGSRLDNPIQRALRDVTAASNHIVFDREIQNPVV